MTSSLNGEYFDLVAVFVIESELLELFNYVCLAARMIKSVYLQVTNNGYIIGHRLQRKCGKQYCLK